MQHNGKLITGLIFIILVSVNCNRNSQEKTSGPLRVCETNPRYFTRVDLLKMISDTSLVSTKYCLANKGKEYLVYKPENDTLAIDLSGVSGTFSVEWFNPNSGEYSNDKNINGGEILKLLSPFGNTDAVVLLKVTNQF